MSTRTDDQLRIRMPRGAHSTESGETCMFWDKVGACRHGSKCAKYHIKPKKSKTVIFWKIFNNPVRTYFSRIHADVSNGQDSDNTGRSGVFMKNEVVINEDDLNAEATRLFKDLFVEFATKYGEVDSILICGNYNPHIGGNVLVKFKDEKTAAKCVLECNDRWYNGKPIFCELSTVNYFEDAICKEFNTKNTCARGDQCNLIHQRKIDPELKRNILVSQRAYLKEKEI